MPFRFIPAKEEHLEDIIQLCIEHAAFEEAAYNAEGKSEKLKAQLFKSNPDLQCILVEMDQKIVGYATFIKQFATWDADYYLYLDCIYMKDNYRGMGIGAQLMEAVKQYCSDHQLLRIEWQTPEFNASAIRFYKRLGATSKSKERFSWKI